MIPTKKNKHGDLSDGYVEMTTQDYSDHLASLKTPFLTNSNIKSLKINHTVESYLTILSQEIISNNEIFFKNLKSAKVTILDSEAPLHFSLPKGEIFFSKGLISKYIKHESMLVGILSYELVRSEKLIYSKETVIPIGYVPLEKMLMISRLKLEEKIEVHKWAYHLTVRSGYDGEYYLSWLQTQNRNTADFILQVGDVNILTKEEAMFKAFLIKKAKEETEVRKKNSSKNFYTFINSVRDRIL
ncbi:MAG: hypothetical protein AB7I27_16765 [Bacteriovoracaceae bacterium]